MPHHHRGGPGAACRSSSPHLPGRRCCCVELQCSGGHAAAEAHARYVHTIRLVVPVPPHMTVMFGQWPWRCPTAEAARGATAYAVCLRGSLAPRRGKNTGEQLQPSLDRMTNRLSLAATPPRALCALSALVLLWSLFDISEAVPTTISVPLSFGQEIFENLLTSYTRMYTAVPQVAGVLATSNVTANFTASSQAISFSSIPITGLTSNLTAAHIHGPCPDANPCNAPVAYVICSGNCPGGTGPIIPAFTVDITQLNSAGVASAVGLYQGILAANKLYYLNFHTAT